MRHSKYIGQLKYSSTKYSVISILSWVEVAPLPVPRWMTTWRQLHPHITWFVLQVSSNLLYNVTFLPYATVIYFDIYLPQDEPSYNFLLQFFFSIYEKFQPTSQQHCRWKTFPLCTYYQLKKKNILVGRSGQTTHPIL